MWSQIPLLFSLLKVAFFFLKVGVCYIAFGFYLSFQKFFEWDIVPLSFFKPEKEERMRKAIKWGENKKGVKMMKKSQMEEVERYIVLLKFYFMSPPALLKVA